MHLTRRRARAGVHYRDIRRYPGVRVAQDYTAIIAAPDRSEADRTNDKRRDPVKLLEFVGPKTGWRVLDMGAGGGYSTELMARRCSRASGKVWGQHTSLSDRFKARLATPPMGMSSRSIVPSTIPFL